MLVLDAACHVQDGSMIIFVLVKRIKCHFLRLYENEGEHERSSTLLTEKPQPLEGGRTTVFVREKPFAYSGY